MLGVGAASYERGHVALGIAFPPLKQRFEVLKEAIQICLQMWSDSDGPYGGRHYRLAETICVYPNRFGVLQSSSRAGRKEDAAAGRAIRRRVDQNRIGG
jgi:alkanesulfonate monooxygenase SsuD/methylene tetrahydromethanopterin reductase-like flavin-dependent oxidoreductase (luciferase family)